MKWSVVLKTCLIAAPIAVLTAALATLPPKKSHLLSCGHPQPPPMFLRHLLGAATGSHCCSAGSMINSLRMIDAEQEIYWRENSSFATRLDQITNEVRLVPEFELEFRSDGTNWSIAVSPQQRFPGYYLLTNLHLYFNPTNPATTADIDLCDHKR